MASYPKRQPLWMVIIYSEIHCKHYSQHKTNISSWEGSQGILKKYLSTSLHDQGDPSSNPETIPAFNFLINFDYATKNNFKKYSKQTFKNV